MGREREREKESQWVLIRGSIKEGIEGEQEIEIKRVRNLVIGRIIKDKGCILKSYMALVLSFIIVIVTSR